MKRWVLSTVVASMGLACTPTGRPAQDQAAGAVSPTPTGSLQLTDDQPVVLTLQTRDHEVAVYAMQGELRFTVSLHGSGAVLAERVDEDEFAKSFPGIHQHFRTAFADESCEGNPGAWAGL